jgi:hypothetical protein
MTSASPESRGSVPSGPGWRREALERRGPLTDWRRQAFEAALAIADASDEDDREWSRGWRELDDAFRARGWADRLPQRQRGPAAARLHPAAASQSNADCGLPRVMPPPPPMEAP